MALTPEEALAVKKDIRDGLIAVTRLLKDVESRLPIAVQRLKPHSTSTRKILGAMNQLSDARRAFEDALNWDITVNTEVRIK